jgi:transglutaminase/protease-like cytokinesis protein 3
MKTTFFIFVLFICPHLKAQTNVLNKYAAVDKQALQIPDSLTATTQAIADYINENFSSEKDKARAAFIWVAANIQYDIENMFAINFYASKEEKINKALKTRKGICENYAFLFNDINLKCGIKSYIIEGYAGKSGKDYLQHLWCIAYIDTSWQLIDPTWGSGYVSGLKFEKKIDNNYFCANPEFLIKTHMPFDYLWQLLDYPVTNQEFYEGKIISNTSKPFFNYIDSIKLYEHQTPIEQLTASGKRIRKNGLNNSMVFDKLQHIQIEIENDKIRVANEKGDLYNKALVYYNDAVIEFNRFIDYQNHQFKPVNPDADIQGMIDSTNKRLDKAKLNLRQISDPPPSLETLLMQLRKSIIEFDSNIRKQQDWLNIYFSKSTLKRKQMFYEKKV